jgi:hypothetical protein
MIRKSTNNFQNISNSFNNHFLSIADTIIDNITNNSKFNESNLIPLEYLLQMFNNPFPNIRYTGSFTSTKEIKNIIKSLKTTYSYGYDEISVKILKNCYYFIISPLTCIINRFLLTGIFPSRLKFSEIKPIYKKGDKNSMSTVITGPYLY